MERTVARQARRLEVLERLPEALAVIDPDGRIFQDDRPLASMVVPLIQAEGMGLVTFDRGLNAADQVARREGVPRATIFRILDAEGGFDGSLSE